MPICINTAVNFSPERDIPSFGGQVILITGANSGLEKQCVLEFSLHKPAKILLTARSLDRAQAAADEIKQQIPGAPIKLLELDLGSFDSIKKAATAVLSETERLDILMDVLNAGIMAIPPGLTTEGYEKTAERDANPDVRVISLSSHGHAYTSKGRIRYNNLKTEAEPLGPQERYSQSKLANYSELKVTAVHPGVVSTNLAASTTRSPKAMQYLMQFANRWLVYSVEKRARTELWASVSRKVESGEYYKLVGVSGFASEDGQDDEQAMKLWEWTQTELQAHGAR
ncbi:short-chain dehydrogenase/reductase [Colletotrichum godetiae]|uniref:Short-chain dehydrogenase/reductase n=1 Tax=Colletotrichum godetiae TaxID=1209918 RepID=A0AAJ0AHV2_9PEZI|nr:short-chain dehydrogenase/reductase [Colletotrichum godetiae]KAK1673544.1 short-chain dehydrogenase/reductase [Colletotrichum godetiae]